MAKSLTARGFATVRWAVNLAAAVSFLAGYVIAIIGGIWWPDNAALVSILVIMGVFVGLFNIAGREIVPYLVAAIALVLIGSQDVFDPLNDVVGGMGTDVNDIVGMMAIFVAPAAAIQAIRAGIALAGPGDITQYRRPDKEAE